MIKQKQLFRHDPDNGVYGDCFRTVIACLLELEPSEVEHFHEHNSGDSNQLTCMRAWLRERGKNLFVAAFEETPPNTLKYMKQVNPDMYYIFSGTSANKVDHAVIAYNDEIVWDPAIDDSGIVSPASDGYCWVYILN